MTQRTIEHRPELYEPLEKVVSESIKTIYQSNRRQSIGSASRNQRHFTYLENPDPDKQTHGHGE